MGRYTYIFPPYSPCVLAYFLLYLHFSTCDTTAQALARTQFAAQYARDRKIIQIRRDFSALYRSTLFGATVDGGGRKEKRQIESGENVKCGR